MRDINSSFTYLLT